MSTSERERERPQISIIVPLYNKAQYIRRAIDSVLSQTIQDFEIIVVGGKSTDSGEEIVKSYSDSRIRLIQETGTGVSAARNQGVTVAKSELIAFLDADDEWLPNFLKTIFSLREKYPDAGMYGTAFIEDTSGDRIEKVYEPDIGEQLLDSYFDAKMKFCNHCGGMLICTSGTVVSKDKFIEVGGFPEWAKQSEDRALRGKIALISDVAYSPKISVIYYTDCLNNSEHIYEYLVDPFSEYIASIPKETLKNRDDYLEIIDFCEANRLGLVGRNLHDYPYCKLKILKELSHIYLPHNRSTKYSYIIQCFIPPRTYEKLIIPIRKVIKRFS